MLFSVTNTTLRRLAKPTLMQQSRRAMSTTHSFDLTGSFETHNFDTAPSNTAEMTKEELVSMFELMYTMRRMEITCDNEYKARAIRGFCHLYDGQEAVATGIQYALSKDDSWITSYRCHCVALARGGSVSRVIGELFGVADGYSHAKGGSMHMYNKEHNFFGGAGIVGAQVPVGAGLAFANKYKARPGEPMNVALAAYGDGAANQGQIWEAANMCNLWGLPMIFCIENNHYGMGTSIDRHSSISDYYKMGNAIPGLRIDGMNVLAVKEGMKFAKEYCGSGNGPMYVEMMTYRYHGHSMSDPGTTYRNREEIEFTRTTRDPLEFVKTCLQDAGFMTSEDIKETEKRIRKKVQKEVLKAKESPRPSVEKGLVSDIYAASLTPYDGAYPPYIRMPDMAKSVYFN
ncbi:pyruvate dehydrogenase alpha subunit [Nitzschia inconspicua]|uniref:pyruvate dehydrogenase (acetyl-transferring) n=1 Tax=Nitzschia inconspicua TaxID=303405 RepID=A0A9K3P7W6_9STRA|nr:pyruvate dehydrogenase alpha subunit [Nitzschia inconspicua]KAG7339522.1 pyruvate dehydrogenase alpha subunit [Nitzschia inconspicua]KAG7359421.1 pyruvate dehydrogenase alpha subunit [Nitzschia inconspicua]